MSTKGILQNMYHHWQTWLPKTERKLPVYQSFTTNAGFTASVELLLNENDKRTTSFGGGPCSEKVAAEQEAASRALVHIMDLESDKADVSALIIINVSHEKKPKIKSSKELRWHDLYFGVHLTKLATDRFVKRNMIFYDPERRIGVEWQRELGAYAQSVDELERVLDMIK